MRRKILPAAIVALVLAAVGAAAAYATTSTGQQNPQFRVTVTITPAHPHVGDTIVATFRIVNTTSRTLNAEWDMTWSKPTSGIGAAVAGSMKPGLMQAGTERVKVTSKTPKGTYTLYAAGTGRRGTSHAQVSVTLR